MYNFLTKFGSVFTLLFHVRTNIDQYFLTRCLISILIERMHHTT